MNPAHTKIFRSGITSNYESLETSSCRCTPDTPNRSLHFHFYSKSKGGGTTAYHIILGFDDLPSIFHSILL